MDSFNEVAKRRIRTSKKTEEELKQLYADKNTSPYEEIRLDDPYYTEKMNAKKKLKPFYDRLQKKQS